MISMTENCADHLQKLAEREAVELVGVRVKVRGGGCSGLSYDIGFETEERPTDQIFGDFPKIFVDPKSLTFVDGLVLDVTTGLVGTAFVFHNPNASKTCGCGSSFSV